MGSEWIKVRKKLEDDPRTVATALACDSTVTAVIGALIRLWFLGDSFAEPDGRLPGYTAELIDAKVQVPGFCYALPLDWFEMRAGVVYLPNYHARNGATARARHLNRGENAVVGREDRPADDGFDAFWREYPKKVSKLLAKRAWAKLAPDDEMQARILAALAQQKRSDQWVKDGGGFVPYPATWLNGRRWEDEVVISGKSVPTPATEDEIARKIERERQAEAERRRAAEGRRNKLNPPLSQRPPTEDGRVVDPPPWVSDPEERKPGEEWGPEL